MELHLNLEYKTFVHCNVYYRTSLLVFQPLLVCFHFVCRRMKMCNEKLLQGSWQKPALLPTNSYDILTVCADVSQVLCFLIPPERLHRRLFSGIWWDADQLQQQLILKPHAEVELMSFTLLKCCTDSSTERPYEHQESDEISTP